MAERDNGVPAWKDRRMEGGVWVGPEASMPPQRADRTIPVKLTQAELAEFDAQIARLGLKRNRALRIAARRIAGFVELDTAQVETLREATKQLVGIARNINQIAKSANRTHEPAYRAFMEERAALGRQMAVLQADLQRLLDLAARREDGLARLERARGE